MPHERFGLATEAEGGPTTSGLVRLLWLFPALAAAILLSRLAGPLGAGLAAAWFAPRLLGRRPVRSALRRRFSPRASR